MSKILLVEDKESLRAMIQRTLEAEGFVVESARDGSEGAEKLRRTRFLMMLTDLRLPGLDGIELLKRAKESDPELPVVVMTAYGTIDDAVKAMKLGAENFLPKPFDNDYLLTLVRRVVHQREVAFRNLALEAEYRDRLGFPTIIGEQSTLRDVADAVRRAGPTDVTILLTGESGTGKELFARAIHAVSRRQGGPFVPINCAAIPEALLENELFGHEKGAYTGAGERKVGRFELANRGTIFLDEIGELSLPLQAKLLRVLQERSFERVGGTATMEVDVRVVAATNRDLKAAVAERQFRQDLFFRLSVFPIDIPPLRSRRDDIPVLADHFVRHFARDLKKGSITIHPAAVAALREHHWPGNVRELQNAIERAVILCDGRQLLPSHFDLAGDPEVHLERGLRSLFSFDGTLQEVLGRVGRAAEKVKIEMALREAGGEKGSAAAALGVAPKTLAARIKDLGLGIDEPA